MAYSYYVYTANGSTAQFNIPFLYVRREHVFATVAGASATFTWVNSSTILMDATPGNGVAVRVYRETPLAEPLVDFTDGATLVAADLDTNAKQSIYIQQELDDGLVDGLVNVIPNGDKGDIITSSNGQVWTIDTGAVTSAKILDGAIVDADINASAGIVDTKLAQITTANKVSGTAITTGDISTTGSITTTGTLSAQGLTFGKGGGTIATNTAVGVTALATNSSGASNTAVGRSALFTNSGGSNNTAVGTDALYFNTANSNTAVGAGALATNSTGGHNTAVGRLALSINSSGNNNTAVGHSALYLNTAINNTAVGSLALTNNVGGADNTAMGAGALANNNSGAGNTGIGFQSLSTNNTANYNTAVGHGALFTNNAANNTAVGVGALKFNTSGANNTAIGTIALEYNTIGSSNVGIGYSVAASSISVNNEVNISNGTVNARFQGAATTWAFPSDVRDKTDIENLALGLDFIAALKPRKFKWNLRNTEVDRGKPSAGFIAQEVLETVEAFNAPYTNLVDTNDPNQYTFAQANMIPMLVKAIQELAAKVEALENSL